MTTDLHDDWFRYLSGISGVSSIVSETSVLVLPMGGVPSFMKIGSGIHGCTCRHTYMHSKIIRAVV
jgi:hypothetical protein